MGLPGVCLLILLGLLSVRAQKKEFFANGGTLSLRPDTSEALTSILWKHNGNLVAEWVKDKIQLEYYGNFSQRTSLDTSNGHLDIHSMSVADVGTYTVEMNSKLPGQSFNVKVMKPVPKPIVWIQPLGCSPASESCNMTCDGKIDEAGPVTISWRYGDGEWKELGLTVSITKKETENVKTFSCRMKNKISQKDSEPKNNPLRTESDNTAIGVGVPLCLLIVGGCVAVCLMRHTISQRISKCRGNNNTGRPTENGSPAEKPGEAASEPLATDENTRDEPV